MHDLTGLRFLEETGCSCEPNYPRESCLRNATELSKIPNREA
jgi:hypothetical protein